MNINKQHKILQSKEDFTTRIARYFLENSRIAFVTFLLFTLVGLIAFFNLKTTGFPIPEMKIAVIKTVYPRANAQTVLNQITTPLETSIKNVSGIERISSISSDNISVITVYIEQKANTENTLNKITTSVNSTPLPGESNKAVVEIPNVSGFDVIFSLFGDEKSQIFSVQEDLYKKLRSLPDTAEIEIHNKLQKIIRLTLDPNLLASKGVNENDIANSIKSFNQSVPVALSQKVDNKSVNITVESDASSIDDLKSLTLTKTPAPGLPPVTYRLDTLANIEETYTTNIAATNAAGTGIRLQDASSYSDHAPIFAIRGKNNIDLTTYSQQVNTIITSLSHVQVLHESQQSKKEKPVLLVQNYLSHTQNQEQVNEIFRGLIGGKLTISNDTLAQIGWLFGAVQLVFLVMVVFVSWRAATIASISIPLSLLATMIYLYFTGNNINTLVLFSLVLVIGLVVDPSLVMLEAIQRKIDAGLTKKRAALEAVKDIGPGLFASTLTNGVVFLPLALVSGILGQMFAFIPATILPALIGSFFVPLIFLTVIGSRFLKPLPGKTSSETENLWPFAKWLIALNTKILHSSAWVRTAIIVLITGLAFGTTAFLINSGKITFAQFSTSSDAPLLTIAITPHNTLSQQEKRTALNDAIAIVLKNPNIISVYPTGLSYYANLIPHSEGRKEKASTIASTLNKDLKQLAPRIDASVSVSQYAPPANTFQVHLAFKTDNFEKGMQMADKLSQLVTSACINEKKEFLFEKCEGNQSVVEKVLNGYSDFGVQLYTVQLQQEKVNTYNLTSDSVAAALLVAGQLRNAFPTDATAPIATISQAKGETVEVYTHKNNEAISTQDQLFNYPLKTMKGEIIALKEVAHIEQKLVQNSIGRTDGETMTHYQIQLKDGYQDQGNAARFEKALLTYVKEGSGKQSLESSGLSTDILNTYSAGGTAEFAKSFGELTMALILAIVIVYIILSVFMQSFSMPLVVLYTIPITFIGIFPAIAFISNGQFGFLEIIGLIILVGLVINAAIFLIDSARQQLEKGMTEKDAIALASGLRLRPVLLTKFTAIASLSPLIFTSEFYKNLALVIVSGIIVSGFLSLITTPILYIAFRSTGRSISRLFSKK